LASDRGRARLRDPPLDEGPRGGDELTVTPGLRTSEFKLFLANVAGQTILALNGNVSDGTATKYTVAGAVAYILARGLAKYETRGPGTAPPA
jgi:hypothetical protein